MEHKAFYKELIDTMASLIKTASDPSFEVACWRKISQRPFTLDVIRYYSVYFDAIVHQSTMCSVTKFEPTNTYIALIDTENYYKEEKDGNIPLVSLVHTTNGPLIAIDWYKLKSDDNSVSMFMGLYGAFRILTEDVVFDAYRSCRVAQLISKYEDPLFNFTNFKIERGAMYSIIQYLNPTAMLLAFHIMSIFGITEIDMDKIATNWFFCFLNTKETRWVYISPNVKERTTIIAGILNTINGLTNGEYDIETSITSMAPQKICEDIFIAYSDNYHEAGSMVSPSMNELYCNMPEV